MKACRVSFGLLDDGRCEAGGIRGKPHGEEQQIGYFAEQDGHAADGAGIFQERELCSQAHRLGWRPVFDEFDFPRLAMGAHAVSGFDPLTGLVKERHS